MNYIGCFNRSRDGLQVCSQFFSFLVRLNAARCGVLHSCPFAPFLVPRCCQVWSVTRAPFAPFLVPRCCQVWTYCSRCPVAPFLVPRCCQVWSVSPLRRSWCASMVPTLLRYTYYSISQILEILQRCPHSWQLVIDFIAYHRDQGIVNKCK